MKIKTLVLGDSICLNENPGYSSFLAQACMACRAGMLMHVYSKQLDLIDTLRQPTKCFAARVGPGDFEMQGGYFSKKIKGNFFTLLRLSRIHHLTTSTNAYE